MAVLGRIPSPVFVSLSIHGTFIDNRRNTILPIVHYYNSFSSSSSRSSCTRIRAHFSPKASSSSSSFVTTTDGDTEEYIEEATTNVKFQSSLNLPGCSISPLSLLGIGYREKVFAIIGVKVYAVGLYVNESILTKLDASKGETPLSVAASDQTLFRSIFQNTLEKSLQIVLVRDVDGKTFWDALDEAISPRITKTTLVDESAMSTFRAVFQGRPLKKGTFIFLTWLEPSKMLVSISSNGLPTKVDATIESMNVSWALFDVFFGDTPVSPSLKASVTSGITMIIK